MKAVILAGGKGTRLAPYTTVFPKPLVPLGQQPIVDIIVQQLMHYGFFDVTFSVGYLSELIEAYFQSANGKFKKARFSYIREKKPLGTAGPLHQITGLDETFLVMNGDVLTSLDFSKLIDFHKEKGGLLTIASSIRRVKIDLGVLETTPDGILTGYVEKPEKLYPVSMGVYVYEPEVLHYIKPDSYLDFPDLVQCLLDHGERVVTYPCEDHWLDIGRHEDYALAQEQFEIHRQAFLPMHA